MLTIIIILCLCVCVCVCAVILSWFIDECIIKQALDGKLIDEEDVECRPERLPSAVLDENVDICLVRRYFTIDAWMLVENVVRQKSEKPSWTCKSCQHDLSEPSIVCDSCLEWHHFKCVGLSTQLK